MIFSNKQIVWTPILGQNSLTIALDRTFADASVAYVDVDSKSFVEAVWSFMGKKLPVTPNNFLDFDRGILPKGFYAGRNGLWLTLERTVSRTNSRPLIYHGHNEDQYTDDRMWLMQAFGAWAIAATTVLNWE